MGDEIEKYVIIGLLLASVGAGCWHVGSQNDAGEPSSDADADTDTDSDSDSDSDPDQPTVLIDLTPPTGEPGGDGGAATTWGYHFVPTSDLHVVAVETFASFHEFSDVHAKICDEQGNLLAEGSTVNGDGTEQWYRSEVDFVLHDGETYSISFYNDYLPHAEINFKASPDQPFAVGEVMTDVYAVSVWSGDAEGGCPDLWNTWAHFVRIEIVE